MNGNSKVHAKVLREVINEGVKGRLRIMRGGRDNQVVEIRRRGFRLHLPLLVR